MKVKLRNQEVLLVTLLSILAIKTYIWEAFTLTSYQLNSFWLVPYITNGARFNYFENVLYPRMGVLVISLFIYLWINLFIIPRIRASTNRPIFTYLISAMQVLVLAYILALGVNAASFYAHPFWFNYGGFRVFTLLGYNDKPLTNLWAGFDKALIIIIVYGVYAASREYLSYRIENSGAKTTYRTLILNQYSAFLCLFLLIPAVLSSFHVIDNEEFYNGYFLVITPAILVYLSNIYWLFPKYSQNKLSLLWRLALSTWIYSFPLITVFTPMGNLPALWLTNWTLQLFIITPISWLIYRQQKDKILQLRGSEKQLVKSRADLKFLRSQINPHFLFNALNTLYGTALVDGSRRTADGIQKLGDMMRFMLDDNLQDYIAMSKEIAYLHNFISLQKLRIQTSDNIVIEEHLDVSHCNHQIVPMLLIPFVENAFKHGINVNEKSWVHIKLTCDAEYIRFCVRNSLQAAENNDPEHKHSGIGLENVTERLNHFYEGRYQLRYGVDLDEFFAELTIESQKVNAL